MGHEDDQVPVLAKQPYVEDMWGTEKPVLSPADRFARGLLNMWNGPVTWFREKVVLPMRPVEPPKYYHQKFGRVPTIEECYQDDVVCMFEAHEQYKRDRRVDSKILDILRSRWVECVRYHGHDQAEKCEKIRQEFQDNETNWFIKYGDVCMYANCSAAYYKQVHRMIWERRQAEKVQALAEQ